LHEVGFEHHSTQINTQARKKARLKTNQPVDNNRALGLQ